MSTFIDAWTGIQVKAESWIPVLNETIKLGSNYKVVPTEGYLAWEYNPLRNYRLNEDMYEKDGKFYTKDKLGITPTDEENYQKDYKDYVKVLKAIPRDEAAINAAAAKLKTFEDKVAGFTLREAGELVDFVTDQLSFNL
mgnify:FL=1